jgi:hypothetical protein
MISEINDGSFTVDDIVVTTEVVPTKNMVWPGVNIGTLDRQCYIVSVGEEVKKINTESDLLKFIAHIVLIRQIGNK